MQTQTSNPFHNAIMEASSKDRPPMLAPGSTVTRTESQMEIYKTVSQDIRDQLKAKAKAIQIILNGIDNNIYSKVYACSNSCEMWKAIERLKQGESINVQDLETNLYWEFGKFTSQDGKSIESYYSRLYKMMNELIRNQCDVTNHQVNVQSQQAVTRNKGKAIVNSSQPIYDQEPSMVAEDDEMSKDKKIDKLMALIFVSFKKIYKPTNNNLRTSSNTSRANQDNSPRINRSVGMKIKGLRDDTEDDELEDQEREAHYMYMAQLQEVSSDTADSGPIFDAEPLQKVSNDDHYNVFAIESEHPAQSESVHVTYPIEQDAHNVIIDSSDMSYDREEIDQNDDDNDLANERELLSFLIEKLKCEIDESKNRNKFLETSNKVLIKKLKGEIEDFKNKNKSLESSNNRFKEANKKLSETNNLLYTDFKKSEAELARRNSIEYASKMEIECAQKAQRANPRLYDIGCYNDNLALMLAPESDEVIRLEKESRSKLSDLIRPFDYEKLNNLYDLFVPQREKSSEQRYFSERSRLSHAPVNNENSKESFNKQTTLLKKRMDESIPWDQKCKSSIELFKIKSNVDTIFDGVERCKQTIAHRTYSGYLDPFIQNTIETNFSQAIRRINAGLEQFHKCLNEEMVADLRYLNSLELEVDSLRS
nr:hypothetical protein [Tanacetum cinerariifolium]